MLIHKTIITPQSQLGVKTMHLRCCFLGLLYRCPRLPPGRPCIVAMEMRAHWILFLMMKVVLLTDLSTNSAKAHD
jgi:hypothetical protein